jgi:basic membrane protein A
MSYQARYLTGIAAGMMTKTNKIGVVGSHAIPEIVRNINALTIGAQSVNPDIEVNVLWINSWFNPPKDMDAAKALLDGGNDILYTTTDSPSVVVVAQKAWKRDGKEVWSMGNDAPMSEHGPDRYITGMMFHWSGLYQRLVNEVANGTWKPNRRLNLGLKQNCVALSPWGVNVPGKVVNAVETVKTAWLDDEMDQFYPFSLGVTKRDGTKVPPNTIKRGELDTMNYFVQGVVGSL